jgi:ADP-heptose:LPS heptosyltransferase
MTRDTAFFINGGAGRVVCSISALEKFAEENPDNNFIIVCEGGTDFFKGHPILHAKAYDHWHKNLFEDKLKNMDIVSPEPYRVWEYYNQKCSLAQAFDIELNGKGVRELPKPTLRLSKDELLSGRQLISEVKAKLKKEKVIVFQPFGRSIQHIDSTFVDQSARSFEYKDIKTIIKRLQAENFAVILMSEFSLELKEEKLKDEIAQPQNVNIRTWAGIIKYADHFLGCDSLGQHLAYAVDTQSTVVIGATFPINVSYPDKKNVNILDMGEITREYSPIRIVQDERVDRANEGIMSMDDKIVDVVIDTILGK